MAIKGIVKELETFLLPQLNEIKGEIKALRGEFAGELKAINTRIDSIERELKDLKESLNVIQRLTIVEQKLKDLKG
ncbi:MAG: hypothetical protein KGH88_01100 [Thaumarchaeota archaeon]|nr:hypothetical protein [Nitrososphaerota archaeon]